MINMCYVICHQNGYTVLKQGVEDDSRYTCMTCGSVLSIIIETDGEESYEPVFCPKCGCKVAVIEPEHL